MGSFNIRRDHQDPIDHRELLCFCVNIFFVVLCSGVLIFLCLSLFCVGLQFDFIPERPHWRNMSKGLRKNAVASEETETEVRSSGLTSEHGSEMMTMLRVLMEEQRRSELAREEARRQEEDRREEAKRQEEERKEVARIERETEATRVRLEQQTAFETRQYEQQVALMRIQAEIGEKASRAHRESQAADRKRDRALYSISVLKEGEDLEEFLSLAERRLRAADIKEEEWMTILDS